MTHKFLLHVIIIIYIDIIIYIFRYISPFLGGWTNPMTTESSTSSCCVSSFPDQVGLQGIPGCLAANDARQ